MSAQEPHEFKVAGRLAESDKPDHIRLELTPDGNQYVDVPTSGVLGRNDEWDWDLPPFIGERVTELILVAGTPIAFAANYAAPSVQDTLAILESPNFVEWQRSPGLAELLTPCLITRIWCTR